MNVYIFQKYCAKNSMEQKTSRKYIKLSMFYCMELGSCCRKSWILAANITQMIYVFISLGGEKPVMYLKKDKVLIVERWSGIMIEGCGMSMFLSIFFLSW